MLKKIVELCVVGLLILSSVVISTARSETATAMDEEAVILRDLVQKQSAPSTTNTATTTVTTTIQQPQPSLANDMAEGQTQRDLSDFNQPLIDQTQLLTATEKTAISQRILNIYQQGKGQIGVIIVPTTANEPIFDYAMRVAERWQLGSDKRDNGLLMVIAINDRRIQILTGYGLEGVIPDIVANRIIRDHITPYFKDAAYAQGIEAGLSEIERILNLDPEIAAQAAAELQERENQVEDDSNIIFVMFMILVFGAIASLMLGNGISASVTAIVTTGVGMFYGLSFLTSLFIGLCFFFLLITTIAQTIFSAILRHGGGGGGGGGSSGGGYSGGSGYSGGGGDFGGGGASGSW